MEDDNNRTRNFLEPGEWAPADCREEIRAIELEYQQRFIREIRNTNYVNTPKRQLARKRNWNKFRLKGFTLNREGLTEEEYSFYLQFKEMMLSKWDDESRRLGLTPGKKKSYPIEDEIEGDLNENTSLLF